MPQNDIQNLKDKLGQAIQGQPQNKGSKAAPAQPATSSKGASAQPTTTSREEHLAQIDMELRQRNIPRPNISELC